MKFESSLPADLRIRTKDFALRVIRLYIALPKSEPAQTLGKQVLRSGTSVAAHYREAYRAKSTADYVNKLQGAIQELDESALWFELFADSGLLPRVKLTKLMQETDELIAIFTTLTKESKQRLARIHTS